MVDSRREVDRILDLGLADLVSSRSLSTQLKEAVSAWRIPEDSKTALSTYGLPSKRTDAYMGVIGDPQLSHEPELASDGVQFYVIGSYGSSRLAVVAESGEVLGIPGNSQVHRQLAGRHPGGIEATMVNSGLMELLECAWKWDFLLSVLAHEQEQAGQDELAAVKSRQQGLMELVPDTYMHYQELCNLVFKRFCVIDPIVAVHDSFWQGVVIDVW